MVILIIEQVNDLGSPTWNSKKIVLKELEHTDGIFFSCTNAIETSAWFMINSTALGPGRYKPKSKSFPSWWYMLQFVSTDSSAEMFQMITLKSKVTETFVKSENTYQGCHIMEHMTLHSYCKPAKHKNWIMWSPIGIINKAN